MIATASAESARGLRRLRILTTHEKRHHPLWTQRTSLLPGWLQEFERTGNKPLGFWRGIYWGWKLFRASNGFDAVVTGSESPAHVFALLQKFMRHKRNRVVHVLIDFPWNPPTAFLPLVLKRLQYWFEAGVINKIIVLGGPEEVVSFATALRLRTEKFLFVPYHTTLFDCERCPGEGEYIFSGGDYTRDYASLIQVAKTLKHQFIIAARLRYYFEGLEIPENVKIVTTSPQEFEKLMAGAKMVVLPLTGGLLHAGGQTVLLNAMALGKPVVVTDDGLIQNYVTHGVTALLVPPGDPSALRDAILRLLDDRDLAKSLGQNARSAASRYSPAEFFERVFALVEECYSHDQMP